MYKVYTIKYIKKIAIMNNIFHIRRKEIVIMFIYAKK